MKWQPSVTAVSMRNRIKHLMQSLGTVFGVFLICLPAWPQGNAGRILGTLTDQSGGVLVGATVTVTDKERGTTRTLITNQAGEYNSPGLLPSTYTVHAEAMGFKAVERVGIFLEPNQDLRVDLSMQPGQKTETITVTEALPMVETTNAELGGTLQSNIIDSLPMNGRNFQNLLQLRPGVMIYPGGTSYSESTNGLRSHDNLYLVNGVYSSTPWDGQSVMNSSLHAGDAGTILPVDAIDELREQENPRAEYGWKPGAIVNIAIKSGTNSLHGTAYAYGRTTALDARNWYDVSPAPKADVGLEQFGGTVGGAIKKDKLFYFANYEGQLYSIGNPIQHNFPVTVPLPSAGGVSAGLCNNLAAGNCHISLIDACNDALAGGSLTALSAELAGLGGPKSASPCTPVSGQPSDGFLGFFPVNPGPGTAVYTSIPSTNTIHGGLGKIDYHVNDKNMVNGMYFFSQGNGAVVGDPTTIVRPEWLNLQHARAQAVLGSWSWTPNSTWLNEFRFGYSHYFQDFESGDHTLDPAHYPFNGAIYVMPTGITNPFYFGMPVITIGGLSNRNGIGQSIGPHITGPEGVLSFMDDVSILRGKHALKLGFEIQSNKASEDITSNGKGPVSFSGGGGQGLVNFFEGNLRSASLFTGDPKRTISNMAYAGFFQDDWRVTPRLTVNAGIRYELVTVIKDSRNELGNFDPNLGLVQVGFGIKSPYQGDHNNFAPRLGLAWDVFGDGKTVVRAAGGIIYESALTFDVTNAIGNLLGLRTIPTGIPLYNNGDSTPIPAPGNIDLASTSYTSSTGIGAISTNWQNFDPTKPINSATNPALYAAAASPACGDGFTQPSPTTPAPTPCSIVGIDPKFRTPYVENWSLGIQRALTTNLSLDISYVGNHGVKLVGMSDVNQPQQVGGFSPGWGDPSAGTGTGASAAGSPAYVCLNDSVTNGPYGNCSPNGNAEQAARPFTAPCTSVALFSALGAGAPGGSSGRFNPKNTCLSYLADVSLVNNSTMSNYNGAQVSLTGRGYHGLSFVAAYTYSHALADASDQGRGSDLSVPINNYASIRQQLYMATNYDIRHRATFSVTYAIPGRKGFGQLLEGWSADSVLVIQSGSPWGQSDLTNDYDGTGELNNAAGSVGGQWNFYGKPSDFTPVHGWTDTNGGTGGLPYFPGGNTAAAPTTNTACNTQAAANGPLAVASLFNFGCYAVGNSILIPPAFGSYGASGRNLWRDSGFKDLDLSVDKAIKFNDRISAQFRAEFFNLFNHPIFCNPNGIAGGANSTPGDPTGNAPGFGSAGSTPDVCASNPEIGSGGPRSIQLGLKLLF